MSKKENKALKPVLIVVVAIVWGAIIVKAITMFSIDNGSDLILSNKIEQKKTYAFSADTFNIVANYRDPFLYNRVRINASGQTNKGSKKNVKKNQVQPKLKKIPCNWPQIHFSGIIQNNSSSDITGLIQLNGKKLIVNQGTEINELEFKVITKDSIVVQKNNCTKSFYRK